MDGFFTSVTVVALAEVGDKTQLLALLLAARFRAPLAIITGIALATLANHALAAWVGVLVTGLVPAQALRWALGLSFIAMALWTLKPDTLGRDTGPTSRRWGPLLTTTVTFFLVEMGDKTQVATVALAAGFDALASVALGTTVGMLIANVPVVLLAQKAAGRLPMTLIRAVAAGCFALLGLLVLLELPFVAIGA